MADWLPTPRFRAGAWADRDSTPPPPVRGYPLPTPTARRPARLLRLRQHVIARHPAIRDLGAATHDLDDPQTRALLAAIAAWADDAIGVRAYELPASQMERLIQVYAATADATLRQRITVILQARMKRRFCALVWHVLQDRFTDPALLSLLFTGAAGRRRFRAGESMRFLDFFRPQDREAAVPLPERVCRTLRASGQAPAAFFQSCEMPPTGALAIAVLSLYFATADAAIFAREQTALASLFASLAQPPADPSTERYLAAGFAAPLARYLQEHEPPACDHALLRQVAPRFGFPDAAAPMWSELDAQQLLRFNQWTHLDRLQTALAEQRNKVRILSALYAYIEHVIADTELPLVFVYFSRFVLVDRAEEPDVMLLYPRAVFTQTYDLFTRQRETQQLAAAAAAATRDVSEQEQVDEEEEDEATASPVDAAAGPVDAVTWPVDREKITKARIAILETRAERDRRKILSQQIIRGTCDRIVHLTFADTPILYARQFLADLLI